MTAEAQSLMGMQLSITGLKSEGSPTFGEITMNQMDGTWSAVFYAAYSSDPGLEIDGDILNFAAMPRTLKIALNSDSRPMLYEFIQSCASE